MQSAWKLEGAFAEKVILGMVEKGLSRQDAVKIVEIAGRFQERVDEMFEREQVFAAIEEGKVVETELRRKYIRDMRDEPEAADQSRDAGAINPKRQLFDDVADALYAEKPCEIDHLRKIIVPLLNTLEPMAIAAAGRE